VGPNHHAVRAGWLAKPHVVNPIRHKDIISRVSMRLCNASHELQVLYALA
jgi:hypothetical protein